MLRYIIIYVLFFNFFRPEITILSAQPMISDLIPPPLIPLPTVNENKIINYAHDNKINYVIR